MKRTSTAARRWSALRWVAVWMLSLLLCGAGLFDSADAARPPSPALPAQDDRAAADEAAELLGPDAPAAPADSVESGLWGWWKLEEIITTTTSPTTPDASMNNYAGWLGDDGGDDQPSLSTTEKAPSVMANTGSFYFNGVKRLDQLPHGSEHRE